jgi:hypothetical protein
MNAKTKAYWSLLTGSTMVGLGKYISGIDHVYFDNPINREGLYSHRDYGVFPGLRLDTFSANEWNDVNGHTFQLDI